MSSASTATNYCGSGLPSSRKVGNCIRFGLRSSFQVLQGTEMSVFSLCSAITHTKVTLRTTGRRRHDARTYMRYKLAIRTTYEDAVVDMVFFGHIAKYLIRMLAAVLVTDFLIRNVSIPLQLSRLVGRSYVVDQMAVFASPSSRKP